MENSLDGWHTVKYAQKQESIGFFSNVTTSESAIFWKLLFDEGLYKNSVVAPGVPQGHQRIRVCALVSYFEEDLERTVEICGQVGKELVLIK
ncbi:MAG: hypothetical protein ACLQPD_10895 [Desulfomonilaceae bacterium]